MDKLNEAIYTNIMDTASVESQALEAHEDWFRHIKSCPQCSNGPFCLRGRLLDDLASKWERRAREAGDCPDGTDCPCFQAGYEAPREPRGGGRA